MLRRIKYYKIIIILLVFIMTFIFSNSCVSVKKNNNEEIIRIHIVANSNSSYDQELKFIIKDKIVEYITPIAEDIENYYEMIGLLEKNLDKLKEIADKVLKDNNIEYQSIVSLKCEEFPIRAYEEVVLPAGIYKSLMIELGEAEGDNWWCVAYPPLCFIAVEDKGEDYFRYKSIIKEIFDER